jgi:cbb3-type cytochrome oxidase cytochrome c subunit
MPATEETYRSQPYLHVVFAVSSVAMALAIVWMILADHLRPWKQVQRQFQHVETAKLAALRDQTEQEQKAKNQSALAEVERKIAEADRQAAANADRIRAQEDRIRGIKGRFEKLDTDRKFQKANLDSQRSFYDGMVDLGQTAEAGEYRRTTIAASEEALAGITRNYEQAKAELVQAEATLADLRGHKDDLIKERDRLNREIARANRILEQKESQYFGPLAWLRGLPLIDLAAPPTKIRQISLPELTINYNFKDVPRYDRCTTCHLGIDKIGYETTADGKPMPQVFASHPLLTTGATSRDPSGKLAHAGLYLDGNGPHGINKLGCTICHGGQGSGTDFTYSSHEPSDLAERDRWQKEHGWHQIHHWDEPMLPSRFLESSCLKCHHQVTDIPQAKKVQAGYDRIVKFGCTGCHTIGGEGSFGPDLTDARQVGPNLQHLGAKVSREWALRWIRNPHAFRPDTRMPRFYEVTNNSAPDDQAKVDAEVHAITHYLFAKSTPPAEFVDPLPPGQRNAEGLPHQADTDAARGKETFLQRGCMACHSHRPYTIADVPASMEVKALSSSYQPDFDQMLGPGQFPDRARPYATADFGPNLSNIAAKFQSGAQGYMWLANWIKAPEAYHPKSLMPNLQVSWQEAGDIASWILSVPGEWPVDARVPDLDARDERGRPFVQEALDELVRLYKVKAGTALSQVDRVVRDMSRDDKLMYLGERTIGRLGCFGCHNIAGFEAYKPIGTPLNGWGIKSPAKLDFAHIGEYLGDHQPTTEGGEKVRDGTDEYYYEKLLEHTRIGFLFQKLHRPRSYDHKKTKEELKSWDDRLRMPQFSWADNPKAIEEVMTFVLGLTGEKINSKFLPHYRPETLAIAHGQRLLDRYNCRGCHVLAMPQYTIPAGTSVAAAMPDFDTNVESSYGAQGRGSDFPAPGTNRLAFYPELTYDPDTPPTLTADDGKASYTIEGMPTQVLENDNGELVLQALQLWRPVTIRGYTFNTGDNVMVDLSKVRRTEPEGGNFAWLYAAYEAERTGGNFADVWNRLPPPLLREGLKVQTPWLTRFLRDPYPIRPATVLRMPRFHYGGAAEPTAEAMASLAPEKVAELLTRAHTAVQEETRALADYFAAADGAEFPYQDLPQRERGYLAQLGAAHPDYLKAGWQMLGGQGATCLQCHAVGLSRPVGGPGVVNGPDLRQVADRFRPDYLAEWLARPPRLVPYTAMPQNIPPHGTPAVPVPKTFEDKPLEMVQAIRDTLLNYVTALEGQLAGAAPASAPAAPAPAATEPKKAPGEAD